MDAEVMRRLSEIADRHEIWQVLQRYGRAMDRMDRELARSCYFDDAIDDHGRFVGAVEDFFDWAEEATKRANVTHHGLMNHHCELKGDDAYAETYFLSIRVLPQAPHMMSMGRYIDHFQRRGGEWRIANRVVIVEKSFSLQAAEAPASIPSSNSIPGDAPISARNHTDVSYDRPPRPRRPGKRQSSR